MVVVAAAVVLAVAVCARVWWGRGGACVGNYSDNGYGESVVGGGVLLAAVLILL